MNSEISEKQNLSDNIIGALVGIARAASGNEHLLTENTVNLTIDALAETKKAENTERLKTLINLLDSAKREMVPDCFTCTNNCGRTSNYDIKRICNSDKVIKDLKLRILENLKSIACLSKQNNFSVYSDKKTEFSIFKALFNIGEETLKTEDLQEICEELQSVKANIC